jgi:hypothetical protein
MSGLGPYSRSSVLAKVDGRTKEARLMRQLRAELVAHVGRKPSATQRALVERAVWLSLHVAQLDAKAAEGGAMTEHDHRTYLAWSNSLSRTLKLLGWKAAAPKPRSLAEHLAGAGAATGAAA